MCNPFSFPPDVPSRVKVMILQRVRSEGLSHISYLLGSGNEAVVIDPRRDCDGYIEIAREHDLAIKYILETHRNEDYVTGSPELSSLTGAEIYHGGRLPFGFGHTIADGEALTIGELELRAIHTPGHTYESMSYVLSEQEHRHEPVMVFTGDCLFVGDVGRTDLLGRTEQPRLAEALYESIFEKLLPLGDATIVCPAHSMGSLCGAALSAREESTVGLERKLNPMLQMEREAFVNAKSTDSYPRPPYFDVMEKLNLEGPPILGRLAVPRPLEPAYVSELLDQGATIADTRNYQCFAGAHIKGSLNIWIPGLPTQAGWFLPHDRPIVLVLSDRSYDGLAARYLARLGFDNVAGYLCSGAESCGLAAWVEEAWPVDRSELITVQELGAGGNGYAILDTRSRGEWQEGHIPGAMNIFLGELPQRIADVPRDRRVATICSSGNRASLAASILRSKGWSEVYPVMGGMKAWRAASYPVVS